MSHAEQLPDPPYPEDTQLPPLTKAQAREFARLMGCHDDAEFERCWQFHRDVQAGKKPWAS